MMGHRANKYVHHPKKAEGGGLGRGQLTLHSEVTCELETLSSSGNSCWPFLMGIRTPKPQYSMLPPTPSPPVYPRYKASPNLWKTLHLLTSQEARTSYPAAQKPDSAMAWQAFQGWQSLASNQTSCLSKTDRRTPPPSLSVLLIKTREKHINF